MTQSEREEAAAVAGVEKLIFEIAHKFECTYADFDDLVQEGRIGAVMAWRKFKPKKGVKYITFAYYYILGAMRDHKSRSKPGLQGPLHTGADRLKAPEVLHFSHVFGDTNRTFGHGEESSREDRHSGMATHDQDMKRLEDREWIRPLCDELTDRERRVIMLRHDYQMSLKEIGNSMTPPVCESRVCQLIDMGITKMRSALSLQEAA